MKQISDHSSSAQRNNADLVVYPSVGKSHFRALIAWSFWNCCSRIELVGYCILVRLYIFTSANNYGEEGGGGGEEKETDPMDLCNLSASLSTCFA